jgi:hypothetical protein
MNQNKLFFPKIIYVRDFVKAIQKLVIHCPITATFLENPSTLLSLGNGALYP